MLQADVSAKSAAAGKERGASRREFLKQSAAASAAFAVPYFVPSAVLGRDGATAPSERITIGMIGTGGMGSGHLDWLAQQKDLEVLAVCDVDGGHVAKAKKLVETKSGKTGCAAFHDFRELVARPDSDAVFVVTPDHWHALASLAAIRAGKDVYCEKPLTNSIGEGRALCDAVKQHGRVLQCGSHERSNPNVQRAFEIIRSGKLGEIKTVRVFLPCDDPHHQQARGRQFVAAPVPDGFDYDFWLGPTPQTPFAENSTHFWWRFNLNYGGGEMTDRGAHIIDLAQMALGLDDTGPVEIRARGTQMTGGLYNVFLDFELENTYANGLKLIGEKNGPRGIKFEGSEGTLFVHIHGGKLVADPVEILGGDAGPESADGIVPHREDFFAAVRSRGATRASAEAAHRTASICHANNIAMRLGRDLKWDPATEKFVGDDEANALLMPAMRAPWSI
jgi:predicted dehydrogenase